MPATLDVYRDLERRIRTNDLDALRARWESGRMMREECAGGDRLPDGRRAELANALGISRAEINNRMQLAKQYAEEDLANLLAEHGAWREIVRAGLGNRGRGGRPAGPAAEDDDAFIVPNRLRARLAAVTRAAHAAGLPVAEDDRYLGYGVEALLEFVEGRGREAWEAYLASNTALREAA